MPSLVALGLPKATESNGRALYDEKTVPFELQLHPLVTPLPHAEEESTDMACSVCDGESESDYQDQKKPPPKKKKKQNTHTHTQYPHQYCKKKM
jgi:hypothetical protein